MSEEKTVNYPVYSVGPDDLGDYDMKTFPDGADFAVYYYEDNGYDGSGLAVFVAGDKVKIGDLGHCSCYGPTSSGWIGDTWDLEEVPLKEFFRRVLNDENLPNKPRTKDDNDYAEWTEVGKKVGELIEAREKELRS